MWYFSPDLDARETAAQQQKEKELDAAEKLQAEVLYSYYKILDS